MNIASAKSKEMILIYDCVPLSSSWEETESPLRVQSLYQVSIHFKAFAIFIILLITIFI